MIHRVITISLFLLAASVAAAQSPAIPLDVAHSPAPLFDDPIWHGASDPMVIWNPKTNEWWMYYTQRRATLTPAKGVDWVHGSAIGIAASKNGATWQYKGTCLGDYDLSDTGLKDWKFNTTILDKPDGRRNLDDAVGHHPAIVMQGDQCLLFYFTQHGRPSVMQIAELTLGADGKVICERNKYAPATQPSK